MTLFVLALPALVAPAPAAPPTLDQLQELLEAIPEALIDRKPGAMPGLVAKAQAGWNQARPGLLKVLPEPDITTLDGQLKAMRNLQPREQAIGALEISAALSRCQPRSRQADLLQADRTAMLAWCRVDAGQLDQLPDMAQAFRPLLDQDQGRHPRAVIGVQAALKRLQESQQKSRPAAAKKALQELLDLVDVFEKP